MNKHFDLELDLILTDAESAKDVSDMEKLSSRLSVLWFSEIKPEQFRRLQLVSDVVIMRIKLMEIDLILNQHQQLLKRI